MAQCCAWQKKKSRKSLNNFQENADFGQSPASLVLRVIISAEKSCLGKTDLTRLLDKLETFPTALNEAPSQPSQPQPSRNSQNCSWGSTGTLKVYLILPAKFSFFCERRRFLAILIHSTFLNLQDYEPNVSGVKF